MTSDKAKPTIASVQILRLIAALIVVLDHCGYAGTTLSEKLVAPFHFPSFPGRLGVDIFFIISGFIMVYISSEHGSWTTTASGFISDRFARIVPIYFIATILYVALFFASGNFTRWTFSQYVTSALFVPYFDDITRFTQPVLPQGWTLNFEMFFYTLFACALLLPRRAGVLFLSGIFVLLIPVGFWFDALEGDKFVLTRSDSHPAYAIPRFWLHPIILEFLSGVALALAREQLAKTKELPQFHHPIPLCLSLIALYLFFAPAFDPASVTAALARYSCALSVTAICVLTVDQRPVGLAQGALVFLGSASYSLYLFHPHVLFVLSSVWKRLPQLGMAPFVPLGLISSLIVSALVFQFAEKRIAFALKGRNRKKIATPLPLGDELLVSENGP